MAKELSAPDPLLNIILEELLELTKLNFHVSLEAPPVRGSRFSIDPFMPCLDKPALRRMDKSSFIIINQNLNLRRALQNPIQLRRFDNSLESFLQQIEHALRLDHHKS